jgi:hypothetical protein
MTQRENQVVELKPVNHTELRLGRQNKKDGKMKVHPAMFLKTQGRLTHCQCRSGEEWQAVLRPSGIPLRVNSLKEESRGFHENAQSEILRSAQDDTKGLQDIND